MPLIGAPHDLFTGPPQGQWTREDWETLLPEDGNRYKIIDGVLYVTTAPGSFHQRIIYSLVRYLGIPAEEQGLAYAFFALIGVFMPGCKPVQPDFLIVRTENASIIRDRRIHGVPDLIVEVLSPHNPQNDTRIKWHSYARAGLPEYAIIDPAARTLRHYWLAAPGSYAAPQVVDETGSASFDCLPGLALDVARLFAGAPDTTL
jgi:Uma2 family endonuclease